MVRKLTAWKTIAVKDATYAVAKENSLKKISIEGYGSATTTGNFQIRHFLVEQNMPRQICHYHFRFTKKLITK